ncbi:MAG: hypothetical protein V7637_6279, partial [Mycobacteriales bacterium]
APRPTGGPRSGRRPRSSPSSPRPATSRPAGRRQAAERFARAGGDDGPARIPGGLTGRAAVLGLVVCALVLSLAYPLKEYLAQRGDLSQLQQQQVAAEKRVSDLEARRRQLADPADVKAQARKRLQYVLPGESVYVVVTPSPTVPPPRSVPSSPRVGGDGSWYDRLWGTVRTADGAAPP